MRLTKKGAVLVEFVIVLPLFLLMLFVMIYGGMLMHDYNGLNELTRAAARYGAVESSGDNTPTQEGSTDTVKVAAVKRYIEDNGSNFLIIYEIKDGGVAVSAGASAKIGDDAAMSVSVTAERLDVPIIVKDVIPDKISSTLKMRIEQ